MDKESHNGTAIDRRSVSFALKLHNGIKTSSGFFAQQHVEAFPPLGLLLRHFLFHAATIACGFYAVKRR